MKIGPGYKKCNLWFKLYNHNKLYNTLRNNIGFPLGIIKLKIRQIKNFIDTLDSIFKALEIWIGFFLAKSILNNLPINMSALPCILSSFCQDHESGDGLHLLPIKAN